MPLLPSSIPSVNKIVANRTSGFLSESSRIGTFQGSSIGRALPSDDWKSVQWNSSNTEHQQSLQLKYEIECHPGYFGDGCSKICRGRDDDIGHYECDTQGERVCLQGWKGAYCTERECSNHRVQLIRRWLLGQYVVMGAAPVVSVLQEFVYCVGQCKA